MGKNMQLSEELVSILQLVSLGLSNKEISVKLNYSTRTVERRIKKLFGIYKVNSRISLAQE